MVPGILKATFLPLFFVLALLFLAYPTTTRAVSNQGLVGYWSFNEGVGTKATDFSGNGNTGTLSTLGAQVPTWVNGKLGKALDFDVTNSAYVDLGTTANLQITGAITICAWAKPRSMSAFNFNPIVARSTDSPVDQQYALGAKDNGDGTAEFGWINDGDVEFFDTTNPGVIVTGRWTHVCGVHVSGDTVLIYINGVSQTVSAVASTGVVVPSGSERAEIGMNGDLSDSSWDGAIDEVRIYNRALGASEIADLYKSGLALLKPPNNLGLVGYWSFNEGTGLKATDFSGNGNTGTTSPGMANPPTATSGWTDGKLGKAIYFDSTDDYIGVPNSSSLNPTSAITVSVWVRPDAWPAGGRYIVSKGNGTNRYALFNNSGQLDWDIHGVTEIAATLPSAGAWHHIVASYTGSRNDLYVDGVAVVGEDVSGAITATTEDLYIGTKDAAENNADTFDGKIDEVRIYNRALSASEIAALYKSGAVKINASSAELDDGSSLQTGLVGHWTFDGKDFTDKIYDRSALANNGYFFGGATSSAKVAGKLGQALHFDGSNTYARVDGVADDVATGAASIAFWFKLDNDFSASSLADQVLFSISDSSSNNDLRLYLIHDTASAGALLFTTGLVGGGLSDSASGISSWKAGTWYHAVATISSNGRTKNLYVNGASEYSGDPGSARGSSSLSSEAYLAELDDGSRKLAGTLDDVRVYNRELSADEAKQLYKLGAVTIH